MRMRGHPARLLAITSLAVASVAALPGSARAATVVNCATQSLQAKLNSAAAGSMVLVKGTCVGNFVLSKNLTIRGSPSATLDGNQAGHVLLVSGTRTIHLANLTITRGLAATGGGIQASTGNLFLDHVTLEDDYAIGTSAEGGAIFFGNGTLSIASSTIRNDVAGASSSDTANAEGGGILIEKGALTVADSTIRNNSVLATSDAGDANATGGGIMVTAGASVHIASSHVDANRARATAASGAQAEFAGMFVGALTLSHSTVSGNVVIALSTGAGGSALAVGGGISGGSLSHPNAVSFSQVNGNLAQAQAEHGFATAGDGGMELLGDLTVTGSSVNGNRITATGSTSASASSPGLRGVGAKLVLTSSTVANNTAVAHAGSGTAMAQSGGVTSGSTLTVLRSTVAGNRISASSGSNDATATGGGIVVPPNGFTMRQSTVSGNAADATATGSHTAATHGGGLELVASSGANRIENSTIAGNAVNSHASNAFAAGGGIESPADTLTIVDSTIAKNQAGERGGGLVVIGPVTVTLQATILAANTAPAAAGPDCRGTVHSSGHNLIGTTHGCTFDGVGTDKLNKQAKLEPLHGNGGPTQTMALQNGSPAINAILPGACPLHVDQRGVSRPQGPRCDIGAFERQP